MGQSTDDEYLHSGSTAQPTADHARARRSPKCPNAHPSEHTAIPQMSNPRCPLPQSSVAAESAGDDPESDAPGLSLRPLSRPVSLKLFGEVLRELELRSRTEIAEALRPGESR
jgi:hypothetical protein